MCLAENCMLGGATYGKYDWLCKRKRLLDLWWTPVQWSWQPGFVPAFIPQFSTGQFSSSAERALCSGSAWTTYRRNVQPFCQWGINCRHSGQQTFRFYKLCPFCYRNWQRSWKAILRCYIPPFRIPALYCFQGNRRILNRLEGGF